MFTGIVQHMGIVVSRQGTDLVRLQIQMPKILKGVKRGSSVSVNGVCLTVTKIQKNVYFFDVMGETLQVTNLSSLKVKSKVNIESSAKFGDEIGGHVVSGHIVAQAHIETIDSKKDQVTLTLRVPTSLMKYIFHKGFVTLEGCSLTVNKPNVKKGTFAVSLIPETLRATTFQYMKKGESINIEIDPFTQAVVETVERIQTKK